MCEKFGIFNSKSVPTYRTRIFTKKAYRTNVPYPYHYKKGVPYQRTVLLSKNWDLPYRTVLPSLIACFQICIQNVSQNGIESVYVDDRGGVEDTTFEAKDSKNHQAKYSKNHQNHSKTKGKSLKNRGLKKSPFLSLASKGSILKKPDRTFRGQGQDRTSSRIELGLFEDRTSRGQGQEWSRPRTQDTTFLNYGWQIFRNF